MLMRDGRITEEGNHDDLMTKDGEYANLIRTFHMEEDEEEDKKEELLDTRHNHMSKTSLGGALSYHSLASSIDELGSRLDMRADYVRSMSELSAIEVEQEYEGK